DVPHDLPRFPTRRSSDLLRGNGHSIAMGMYGHPTWAGGGPATVFQNNGSIVRRDHLPLFSESARDLARFLVTEYNPVARKRARRSEEHTSELQSRGHLVC